MVKPESGPRSRASRLLIIFKPRYKAQRPNRSLPAASKRLWDIVLSSAYFCCR